MDFVKMFGLIVLFGFVATFAKFERAVGTEGLPSELNYLEEGVNAEAFFPIGWSPDGKFLFATAFFEDGPGCLFVTFMIQDMVSDEKVWSSIYDGCEYQTGDFDPGFAHAWEVKSTEIRLVKEEFQIQQLNEFELHPPDLSHNGINYTVSLETTETEDPNWGIPAVSGMKVTVSRPDLEKQKQIYAFSTEGFSGILGTRVAGCIVSPLEPRMAVVVAEVNMGWEGPPHPTRIRLIGCHLEYGLE